MSGQRRSSRISGKEALPQLTGAAGGVPVDTPPPGRAAGGVGTPPKKGRAGSSPSRSFVSITDAKHDPISEPPLSLNDDCLRLTPNINWTTIKLEDGIDIRNGDWVRSPARTGNLCENTELLQTAIDLRGVPENPRPMPPDIQPMLIVTLAPPCSGKGSVLKTVYSRLGIPSEDCILNADPDNIFYESITEMLGYMPPKTEEGWLGFVEAIRALGPTKVNSASPKEREAATLEAKRAFARYEEFIPLRLLARENQRPIAPGWACTSRAAKLMVQTKYEPMLDMTRDYIFQKAREHRLNIVLNVTGSGALDMIDRYITKAQSKEEGYQVVIVGIHSTVANCKARAKDRNSKQHRYMSENVVESTNYDFQIKGAIFDWEQKSRENGYRFILLENTWIPGEHSDPSDRSDVTLLCDRLGNGSFNGADGHPIGSLLTTGGVYGMRWDSEKGTFNIEEKGKVQAEAAAAKDAAAARKAASGKGAGGGIARSGGASRKRRLPTSRPRRTMKKYGRRITRRRSPGGRGGHRSRRSQRHY